MKTKCYRYDSPEEFDQLIEKFGPQKFHYIPERKYIDSGYLYDQETYDESVLGGYTSATREVFREDAHGSYKNCVEVSFEDAMKPATLEEEIKAAQKYIDKEDIFYVTAANVKTKLHFVPKQIKIAYRGDSSAIADKYMADRNLDFCVAVSNNSSVIPVGCIVQKPRYKEVVLNDEYTAIVYKDEIKVGCQTIPIKKVKEILEANKDL